MLAMVIGQLRRRSARAFTLLAGVLVASMGFTLLTGSVETSRLRVQATADENYRAVYDILVRPEGSPTATERRDGEVRPNFLSGQFGGITLRQWEEIAAVDGVEVAAPIAMIGYQQVDLLTRLDVTGQLDPAADRQLLRVDRAWLSDRGLTEADDPGVDYVYVTRHPVVRPNIQRVENGWQLEEGYTRDGEPLAVDVTGCADTRPAVEIQPDGTALPLCMLDSAVDSTDELTAEGRDRLIVVEWHDDGTFTTTGTDEVDHPGTGDRATLKVPWPSTLLTAAVDPAAEAELLGLDSAVTSGDYLAADGSDLREATAANPATGIPVLASDRPQVDESLRLQVSRVDADAAAIPGQGSTALAASLAAAPAERLAGEVHDITAAYREGVVSGEHLFVSYNQSLRPGTTSYESGSDPLRPRESREDDSYAWDEASVFGGTEPPWLSQDTAFRSLESTPEIAGVSDALPLAELVGTFDPDAIQEAGELSEVPLETYRPAAATGADERSQDLLGGEAWLPNGNPAGYLATPPQLLTSLPALEHLLHPADPQSRAPLSAVRVRVAEVTGMDDASRERIRRVAEDIATATGLTVDITIGSSPAPREVQIAAGEFGRPELLIEEQWTHKGAAVALVEEADRKSVLLLALVLVVCVLFVGNVVAASVRTRRAELGVLSCVGWSGGRLTGLVLGEVALVATAAAGLAAALAYPLARLFGLEVMVGRVLLTVPLVIALALLAALGPALRAARTGPGGALRPAVLPARRARARRTVTALALSNVARVPLRSALAVAAMAIGAAAVTFVAAVLWHFQGAAAGTLLGDAVSVEVRGVDVAAVLLTVVLGAFALADVLYVGLRERDAELAALRATGWTDRALSRLVLTEGAVLGAVGAVLGAAAGTGLVVWLVDEATAAVAGTALLVAAGGLLLAMAACLVPLRSVRALPLAALLAHE
ncbi:FtsX-like permease family protein [Streptomyces sp. 6N223]|uniref:FtsX-like permease family protein n=1 Tax=Streptomyces sp. 6N223 TaxID=3457412 RepID=UPI003FD5F544